MICMHWNVWYYSKERVHWILFLQHACHTVIYEQIFSICCRYCMCLSLHVRFLWVNVSPSTQAVIVCWILPVACTRNVNDFNYCRANILLSEWILLCFVRVYFRVHTSLLLCEIWFAMVKFGWTNSSTIQLFCEYQISHKLSPFSKSRVHVCKHCR